MNLQNQNSFTKQLARELREHAKFQRELWNQNAGGSCLAEKCMLNSAKELERLMRSNRQLRSQVSRLKGA